MTDKQPNDMVDDIFSTNELDEIEAAITKPTQTIPAKSNTDCLIIQNPENIINGLIPIQITNIFDIIQSINIQLKYISCTLSYKFKFPTHNKYYNHNIWQSQAFDQVSQDGSIHIKVPLFLLPYFFNLIINMTLIGRCPEKSTYKEATIKSDELSISIPSILLENKIFNIGDEVLYEVENASFTQSGIITKFIENDMIEIKIDPQYESDEDGETLIVIHKSKVSRDCIPKRFVVDVTNISQAYKDLIIRNDDGDALKIFDAIYDAFVDIYGDLRMKNKSDYDDVDGEFIPNSVAVYVYGYLFMERYNLRMNCAFDGKELFYEEMWPYDVRRTMEDQEKGMEICDLQESWDWMGYSCDLCRVEVRYFETMWHCKNKDHVHDYCLSCIHSMVQQYNEMNEFLIELLDGVVNKDCIKEIVVFCVGKVNRFDVE